MGKEEYKTTEAQRRASIKWQKENYSRIPLDVPKSYHEKLKVIAKNNGMSLNGYIKQAIKEKIERDSETA